MVNFGRSSGWDRFTSLGT